MPDLADPIRQPQRFVQQADALMRTAFQHPDGADPVAQIDQHLEASFAHALEDARKEHETPAAPSAAVAHPLQAIAGTTPTSMHAPAMPIEAIGGDAAVAPFQGVINPFAGGPLMTYGGYMPLPVSGIPNATVNAPLALGANAAAMASHPMGPELESLIAEMSGKYTVPDWLVRNVIRQESGGNPSATSPVGAQGLMQLMPGTAHTLGVTNAYDPRQNVEGGVKYLRQLLDLFHGDQTKAVAAYNAGPAAVQRYGGVPPFAETQNYVKRILG